MEILLPLM